MKKNNLEVKGKRLLVKPVVEEKKASAIILEDEDKPTNLGLVVQLGDGEMPEITSIIKVGDLIMFRPHSYQSVDHQESEHWIIESEDVFIKLEPK